MQTFRVIMVDGSSVTIDAMNITEAWATAMARFGDRVANVEETKEG